MAAKDNFGHYLWHMPGVMRYRHYICRASRNDTRGTGMALSSIWHCETLHHRLFCLRWRSATISCPGDDRGVAEHGCHVSVVVVYGVMYA